MSDTITLQWFDELRKCIESSKVEPLWRGWKMPALPPRYVSQAEFTGAALEGNIHGICMDNPRMWTAKVGAQEVRCRVHARPDLPLGPGKPSLKPKYPYGPQERRRYPIAR